MSERRHAWVIVALLFVYMMLNFSDKAIVGLSAVPIMTELGLTPRQFGLVGSSFFFLFSLTAVIGGFVANRVQTRWVLLVMTVVWAATQLPMIGSIGFTALIGCRIALGAAEGPAYPVAVHSLYKWFPDRLRALPTALVAQGAGLGLAASLPALNWIIVHYSWHWAFGVLGIAGLLWPLAWLRWGREGPLDDSPQPGRAATFGAPRIPYRRLLLNGTVLTAYFGGFAHYWGLSTGLVWATAFLIKGLGYSQAAAGTITGLTHAAGPIVFLAASWYSQILHGRGMPSRLARGVFVGICLALGGLSYMLLPLLPARWLVIAVLTLGVPLAAVIAVIMPAVIGEIVPVAQRGAMLAIGTAVATLAGVLAPYAMGDIVAHAATPGAGFFRGFAMIGVVMFAAGVLAMLFIRPERAAAQLEQAAAVPLAAQSEPHAAS